MKDVMEELSQLEGLSAKDAVLARALIRNAFIDPRIVLEAARATAAGGDGGLLERLTSSGHLDADRAQRIEEALERKLEERRNAAAEAPTAPMLEITTERSSPEPRSTPKGGPPDVWRPGARRSAGDGSSFVLLKEIKDEIAARERHSTKRMRDPAEELAATEAARSRLEARLRQIEPAAAAAEARRSELQTVKSQLVTAQAEAKQLQKKLELKEEFLQQLTRQVQGEQQGRKRLEAEQARLAQEVAELKRRISP